MMTGVGKAKPRAHSPVSVKKVLIVDDHPMIRQAVAEEVRAQEGLTVCGEAADSMAAIELARQTQPDAAIVDLRLDAGHGLELISQLCEMMPNLTCLVYSMFDEERYAERALAAGALGYLSKRASTEKIVEALQAVLHGEVYVSEATSSRLLRRSASKEHAPGKSAVDTLSDRELAVFELIGEGKNVHEIAEQMTISPKTVDAHRQRIKRKLEIEDNAELSRAAVEWAMTH